MFWDNLILSAIARKDGQKLFGDNEKINKLACMIIKSYS
jgi:hypothetical protein